MTANYVSIVKMCFLAEIIIRIKIGFDNCFGRTYREEETIFVMSFS